MERRLLIVDDEPDMLHLLKRSLEPDLKCAVETASSGLEAMEILSRERFDLILADIKMPKMDGLELLEKVQAPIYGPDHGHDDRARKHRRGGPGHPKRRLRFCDQTL